VVGMGGVQNAGHARDLMDVGATLVAVGTESFRDPAAGAKIARELHRATNGDPPDGVREAAGAADAARPERQDTTGRARPGPAGRGSLRGGEHATRARKKAW